MIFAQVPQQAFFDPNLKGLRFEIFAAVILEEFESGVGVCRLSLQEMSVKYPSFKNYDNFCRVRKQMIEDGYLIEVVGGIITKTFNTTAKNAVETNVDLEVEASELRKLQSTEKIAVDDCKNCSAPEKLLQKTQLATAKIAGTEVALKDLDFKKDYLKQDTQNAQARARWNPLHEFYEAFPNVSLTLTQIEEIQTDVTDTDTDRAAWRSTVKIYKRNYNAKLNRYDPEKIGNVLSVFNNEKQQLERKTDAITKRDSHSNGNKSAAEKRLDNINETEQRIAELLAEGIAEQGL